MIRHPGFEAAIDENPLESSTHAAYADWHDENDQPEEAAFRRAMGEWARSRVGVNVAGKNAEYRTSQGHPRPFRVSAPHNATLLPNGVEFEKIPSVPGNELDRESGGGIKTHGLDTHIHWKTYRDMEEAFRRAFMAGRNSPEQLSRAAAAIRRAVRTARRGA